MAKMNAGGGTSQLAANRWADAATWAGEGIVREAFFFRSAEAELYGSVYAAEQPLPVGVVICNSWGYEANLVGRIVHPVSIAVAQAGGVALNFHYPGFGDSGGDAAATTVEAMATAAQGAVREASRRYPGTRWVLMGLMLGASVAALAADRGAGVERLLLVQPALRPGGYLQRLAEVSKRALAAPAPEPAPGFAYGYPLPPTVLESALAADAGVAAALAGFAGEGTIVSYEKPEPIEGAPQRFERVHAPGSWRFGLRNTPALTVSIAEWLRSRLAEAEAAPADVPTPEAVPRGERYRRPAVEARLREFIAAELLEEPFHGEDPLAAGAVDSLGVEQLIEYLFEVWGVELLDEDVVEENFESIAALAALVERKTLRAAGAGPVS